MKQKTIIYENATKFEAIVKQSNGKKIQLAPGEKLKAEPGTHFTARHWPKISKFWYTF